MKHDITVIPFQGEEIKPQNFQSLKEQPQTPHDIRKVTGKGFTPGIELKTLLDNDVGREILQEIGTAHENGHVSRCQFITEQSTKLLNMAEPQQQVTLDYRAALKARNDKMHIPDELNVIKKHTTGGMKPETPKPGKKW